MKSTKYSNNFIYSPTSLQLSTNNLELDKLYHPYNLDKKLKELF